MIKRRNEKKDIKVFAGGIGVIALIIGGISFWKGGNLYPYILVFGILFSVTGLVSPDAIKPVYKKWMIFAGILGRFQTKLILYIIFYLFLTPMGLIMKLGGKNFLEEKMLPDAETYWKKREPERDPGKRYFQQF
ncbi:MAG: SxtJ family membrane protein [Deltaproteobacteria bacterium]|nr:SxtJ family membrane protein [Deltaproteobacteria bacterium]